MSVKYKVITRPEPGVKGGGVRKYYASLVTPQQIDFHELAVDFAANSTVSEVDAVAVAKALEVQLRIKLLQGLSVRFGDIGSFRLGISSECEEREEDITPASIKRTKIVFSPAKDLKHILNEVVFVKSH